MLEVFLGHVPPDIWRQDPLLNLKLTSWLDWLVSKSGILLPLPPQCWDYKCMLLCLAFMDAGNLNPGPHSVMEALTQ